MDSFEKSKREYEFKNNVSYALALQFKKPIIYDLFIPEAKDIRTLMYLADDILGDKKINPEDVNCMTNLHYERQNFVLKNFMKFSGRVKQGVEAILWNEDCSLNSALGSPYVFGHEWVMSYGTWYRFRDGMKQKVQKEVEKYFSKDESKGFSEIGEIIEPYVDKLHLPCPAH